MTSEDVPNNYIWLDANKFKDVRAQNFPHTDFVKTLTAGREW